MLRLALEHCGASPRMRDPNSGQDADFTGYNFWLDKLNRFNGNSQNAEMVKAFLTSIEYRGRLPR